MKKHDVLRFVLCAGLSLVTFHPVYAAPAPEDEDDASEKEGAVVRAGAGTAEPAAVEADTLTNQERRMLQLARRLAKECQTKIEAWIENGETSEAKLFSFLYFPIENTDPPKFHTDWDKFADRDIQALEDAILAEESTIAFAVLVDLHGYLPAHNSRYAQPLTGDRAVDLVNNRNKRIFADRTGYAAATHMRPYLIQRYSRDTGEMMADLSVPVYVKGRKWGAVRLGYRAIND